MMPATTIATNGMTAVEMIFQPASDRIHSRKSLHHCMGGTIRRRVWIARQSPRVAKTLRLSLRLRTAQPRSDSIASSAVQNSPTGRNP